MRVSIVRPFAIACAVLAATPVAEAGESGWYFSAGGAVALGSGMDQEGWNRDTVCYPTGACFVADPAPEIAGYRWRYAIDADPGAGFELTCGRRFGPLRLEVSGSQSRNDIEQDFAALEYLDGRPWAAREGSVVSNDVASIGYFTTRVLALNLYRDFRAPNRVLTPYLGAGLGAAFAEVSELLYSNDYQDTSESPPVYDPPLSYYNSRQDVDHSDTAAVVRLHAGADWALNEGILLGARLTYSRVGKIEDTGTYAQHPMQKEGDPPFTNQTTFDAAHGWNLGLTLKRRFGS